MQVIRDENGKIIRRSQNLRGVRTHAQARRAVAVSIDKIGSGEGKLCVLFANRDSFETNFASFNVLKGWVRRWRAVYGAELMVNGSVYDSVSSANPALAADDWGDSDVAHLEQS